MLNFRIMQEKKIKFSCGFSETFRPYKSILIGCRAADQRDVTAFEPATRSGPFSKASPKGQLGLLKGAYLLLLRDVG